MHGHTCVYDFPLMSGVDFHSWALPLIFSLFLSFFLCWKLSCTILFPALYLYYRFAHIYHYLLFSFWLKKKKYMLDCQKIRKLRSFPKEEKISTWTKISQWTNLLLLPRNSSFQKKKKKKRKRFWGKCKLSLMSQPIDSNKILSASYIGQYFLGTPQTTSAQRIIYHWV